MARVIVVSEFDGTLATLGTQSAGNAKEHDDSVHGSSTAESEELADEDEEIFLESHM